MATTYGYGGEFSSDEDIDRIEQQSDRLVQSKFDSNAQVKPTKNQIEEAIEAIKRLPLDQDFNLTDELLAGLLDHYKTQRGPIVDSTRNLYKKIVLRLIRGEQQQQQASNGDNFVTIDNSNGNVANNNNVISNHNLVAKLKPQQAPIELGSSDEDEPMLPASQSSVTGKKLDTRVLYNNDKIEPMEVDSETPNSQTLARNRLQPRQVNEMISSSSSESSSDESSEESDSDSDSEVLDLTPVKNQVQSVNAAAKVTNTKLIPAINKERKPVQAVTPAQTAVSTVKSSATSNEAVADSKKKPYTRSQRVVTTRSSSKHQNQNSLGEKKTSVSSSKQVEASASNLSDAKPLSKSVLKSKFKVKYFVFALIVVLFAFLLFHFRLDLSKSTDRVFKRAINF